MGLACSNGDGENGNTAQTPFQILQDRVTSIEGNYARSTEISSIANDISGLRADLDALAATQGKDWAGDISTLQASLTSIELILLDMEARLLDLEEGDTTPTKPLELSLLSTSPLITKSGNYSFTVRVTNTAVQPETGRIVLQLHAYSGSVGVALASAVPITGGLAFSMPAEYDPTKTATQKVTIFSDSIVVGASSSKIYEFKLVLAHTENDPGEVSFEWKSTLAIAQ